MHTMTSKYLGELRTESEHIKSGNVIITDAPTDNNGKGEAFSPTDLVCSALNSCMMTLMGIMANRKGLDIAGMTSNITKVMASNPRKIAAIEIEFTLENLQASDKEKELLKRAALSCPVALSLSDNVEQKITFNF
ncbi:MAG: OsmC family protein [Bacteroidota bacterium]